MNRAVAAWEGRVDLHPHTERADVVVEDICTAINRGRTVTLDIDRPHRIITARSQFGIVILGLEGGDTVRLGACYSLAFHPTPRDKWTFDAVRGS